MHPNTKPTLIALGISMLILGILLLPLPLTAYSVLKFILSLFLFYAAAFFLRPCKNLMFTDSEHRVENGARNPADGTFTGRLEDARNRAKVADLDEDNSQIIAFLGDGYTRGARALPPISLKLALGLVLAAVVMNPFTQVHLPRTGWMALDVLVIALLGYAWYLIVEENEGSRPPVSLTRTVGQPPEFPFIGFEEVVGHIRRFWPIILGAAFVLGLLGSQIGGGRFEDISLLVIAYKSFGALAASAILSMIIFSFTETIASKGIETSVKSCQIPGEFIITVFLLILMSLAFGGFFSPVAADKARNRDRYEDYDEY